MAARIQSWRLQILLSFAVSCFWPSFAWAQLGQLEHASISRYVEIPMGEGNIEAFLRDRFIRAEENESLKSMLDLIRPSLSPETRAQIDALDLDNPALRVLLKTLKMQAANRDNLSQPEIQDFANQLRLALKTQSPDMHFFPPSNPSPRMSEENLARVAESLLQMNSRKGGIFAGSPAVNKARRDFKFLADLQDGGISLDDLPAYLRFSEGWDGGLTEKMFRGMESFSLPVFPDFELPEFRFGVSLPSFSAPSLASLPQFGNDNGLLWAVPLGIGLAAGWQVWRGLRGRSQSASAALGPWPVDPNNVSTRAELVRAFDYVAQLRFGAHIRCENHKTVANRFSGMSQTHAEELSRLYEAARYTEGDESLSASDRKASQRALCFLAGNHE